LPIPAIDNVKELVSCTILYSLRRSKSAAREDAPSRPSGSHGEDEDSFSKRLELISNPIANGKRKRALVGCTKYKT
jgi:hypothetical protein